MDQFRTSLPPASTAAYKELNPDLANPGDANARVTNNGEQLQQTETKPSLENDPSAVLAALQAVAQKDAAHVLTPTVEIPTVSTIIPSLQQNIITANEACLQFRTLCDSVIWSTFTAEKREQSQAASDLLDMFNVAVNPELAEERAEAAKRRKTEATAANETEPNVEDGVEEKQQQQQQQQNIEEQQLGNTNSFFLPPTDPATQQFLTITTDDKPQLANGQTNAKPPLPPNAAGRPARAAALKTVANSSQGGGPFAVAGAGAPGKKRRGIAYNPWTKGVQAELAMVLREVTRQPSSPGPSPLEFEKKLSPLMMNLLKQLKEMQACEQMKIMGATFNHCLGTLQVGQYLELEEFSDALSVEAHNAVTAHLQTNADVRRGRATGWAESFTTLVTACIENTLNEIREAKKMERMVEAEAQGVSEEELLAQEIAHEVELEATVNLPASIKHNMEPYRHGEWRKTPFVPRPYVRLSEYYIVEEATKDVIQRKLKTAKHGGCSGDHCTTREELGTYSLENDGFVTQCSCLAKNTECDAHCGCQLDGDGKCLNRAVTKRETVKMGEDVEEVNSWGMDCYARRNIQDAVLESQVFGPYKMPKYKGKGAQPATQHAATAAGQHAQVVAAGGSPAAALATSPHTTTTLTSTEDGGNECGYVTRGRGRPRSANSNKTDATTTAAAAPATTTNTHDDEEEPQNQLPQLTEKEQRALVEHSVVEWLERKLIPSINRQAEQGWDIMLALQDVKKRAEEQNDVLASRAADAVIRRVDQVGYNHFRIHPKGVGLVCKRTGGLSRLTFIEEYLGEIHTPWRWFELQDAVKKITGDELPDFYNILLERPKDDPGGYDVLFVDAAAKGAFASRMSHSCTPNCQAVVMACGGRLTIALYTLRHVHEGEELTFDYSSVTESEKEFREAICLCGTAMCRGSYLYFTGSRAFQQVMNQKHNMLHRQAVLARAGAEELTEEDLDRVKRHGLGDSALGSVEHGDRVPDWLLKWTALICEYLEVEEACLKQELLDQPNTPYTEITAAAEAKGVISNRLQNIVITLDKVKMFLSHPDQPRDAPPLRSLDADEIIDHLWTGDKSIAKRALRGISAVVAPLNVSRKFVGSTTDAELSRAVASTKDEMPEHLKKVCDLVLKEVATPEEAKQELFALVGLIREIDIEIGGGLTAAADLVFLYASTTFWITSERGYHGQTSPPVPINLKDLFLNREQTQLAVIPGQDGAVAAAAINPDEPGGPSLAEMQEAAAARKARTHSRNPALRKKYNSSYVWGQLNGWFKQTVNDPTASLSAERRGTLSLPDVESAFKPGYGTKERNELINHITKQPSAMWKTGTLWSFKNEAKIYGSPMLDAAWLEVRNESEQSPLPTVIQTLKTVKTPPLKVTGGRGKKGSSGGFGDDDDVGGGASGSGGSRGRRGGRGGRGKGRGGGRGRGQSAATVATVGAMTDDMGAGAGVPSEGGGRSSARGAKRKVSYIGLDEDDMFDFIDYLP